MPQPVDSSKTFGPSWRLSTARIDLEAVGWQVNHGPRHSTDVSILAQARLSIAYGIGPISLVAGGGPMETARDVTVTKWPSVFVGVRL